MTHYEVLELPENAPAADIRRAYRRLVLLTHPDRTPDPAAHARYLAINAAYETLSAPGRRAVYDAALHQPAAPATAAPTTAAPPTGRARDPAYRASRTSRGQPSFVQNFTSEYATFFRLTRPVLLGALLLALSVLVDWSLARENPETILRTDGITSGRIIHYATGGRFTLEEEIPVGTRVMVYRTPFWQTAMSCRNLQDGAALELTSIYGGASNSFWFGLLLASLVSLQPWFGNQLRLMATLTALICAFLTVATLFSN